MAKIKVNDVDRFKTGGANDFFALKKDKESAIVRFLYEDEDDLDLFAVHEVTMDGKKRWVSCLDNGHCPLCQAGVRIQVKLFLQMYVDGEVKTWERGKTFLPKILGYFDKCGPLVNRDYEIVRHGKPQSTDTVYELYPCDKEDITLEEFLDEVEAEKQDFEGTFILDWDEDEMGEYLDGNAPRSKSEPEEEPAPRRRGTRDKSERSQDAAPSRRGTRRAEPEEEEEEAPQPRRGGSRRGTRKAEEETAPDKVETPKASTRGNKTKPADKPARASKANKSSAPKDGDEVF